LKALGSRLCQWVAALPSGISFNDGKISAVINNMDRPPLVLKNVNPDQHHWVELICGRRKSPKDAVGATVYLLAGGLRQREDVLSDGNNLSSNDFRPHFGLSSSVDAGTAEIH
jgi:enediyne biosynthesis protein E4